MAEDRFANVFNGEVTLSAANTLTFAELMFGISLRDKMAIAIDQLFVYITGSDMALMTAAEDSIHVALTNSDAITNITDYGDRRNLTITSIFRNDYGTAASAEIVKMPIVEEFSPPMIVLPTRLFLAGVTTGLASAITLRMRIHFRTVPITSEQQLTEVLESFQLST